MSSWRRLILLLLLSVLVTSTFARGTLQKRSRCDEDKSDLKKFKRILEQVDDKSLHEALHALHPAFQDGVYEGDHSAAEAIHKEDPDLATQVVSAAGGAEAINGASAPKFDLLKREANNTSRASPYQPGKTSSAYPQTSQPPYAPSTSPTSSPTYPPQTSSPPGGSPYPPPHPTYQPPAHTHKPGGGGGKMSYPAYSHTSSVEVIYPHPYTKTNAKGHKYVTTKASTGYAYSPGIISLSHTIAHGGGGGGHEGSGGLTTTDHLGNTVVLPGSKSAKVVTMTNSKGVTLTTTIHPKGHLVSRTILETATMANGQMTVYTSYAIVAPPPASGAQGAQPEQTGPAQLAPGWGTPSKEVQRGMLALVGGAIGAAVFL